MNYPVPYKFRCPACRRVFARSFSRVRLGPGIHECLHCHARFPDGSVDWPRAAHDVKMEYLFPSKLLLNSAVGIIVSAILALSVWPYWNDIFVVAAFGTAIVLIPLFVHLIGCAVQIPKSISRYERHLLEQAGYSRGAAGAALPK